VKLHTEKDNLPLILIVFFCKFVVCTQFDQLLYYFFIQTEHRRKQQQVEYQAEYVRRRVVVAQKAYCIISSSREYTYIFKVGLLLFICVFVECDA